jgi:threonine/homoserine/homoserine lactone efflux protein
MRSPGLLAEQLSPQAILGPAPAGCQLAYLAAATAGLAAIFTAVPAAYAALKIAGALYLLYLAWQALRPGGTPVFAPRPLPPDRAVRGHAVPGAGPPR